MTNPFKSLMQLIDTGNFCRRSLTFPKVQAAETRAELQQDRVPTCSVPRVMRTANRKRRKHRRSFLPTNSLYEKVVNIFQSQLEGQSWTGSEREQCSCNRVATHFTRSLRFHQIQTCRTSTRTCHLVTCPACWNRFVLSIWLPRLPGESRKGSRASGCQLVGRPRWWKELRFSYRIS